MSLSLIILIAQKFLLVVSFLFYLFWTWSLGRAWGFHREKILDLAFIAPAAGLLSFWLFSVFGWGSESVFLLGSLAFVLYFTNKEIWSSLKIGDIFALSVTIASTFYPYYPSPLFNLLSGAGFYILYRVYKTKPRSGFVFFTFLLFISVYLFALSYLRYKNVFTFNSTLSLVGLYFGVLSLKRKEYKFSMDLLKYSLPADILEKLKRALITKKKNLEDEGKNLVSEDESLDSTEAGSPEEEDRALVDTERDRNDSAMSLIEQSKKEVDAALKKMESGTYGLCENCHKPIDKARLETYPETQYCIDCAPKFEQKEEEKETESEAAQSV